MIANQKYNIELLIFRHFDPHISVHLLMEWIKLAASKEEEDPARDQDS